MCSQEPFQTVLINSVVFACDCKERASKITTLLVFCNTEEVELHTYYVNVVQCHLRTLSISGSKTLFLFLELLFPKLAALMEAYNACSINCFQYKHLCQSKNFNLGNYIVVVSNGQIEFDLLRLQPTRPKIGNLQTLRQTH